MRMLFITDSLPSLHSSGGSTRRYYLVKELSRKHLITVLAGKWPETKVELSDLYKICEGIEFFHFREIHSRRDKKLPRLIGEGNWERIRELKHLLFEYPQAVQGMLHHFPNFQIKLSEMDLGKFDLIQIEESIIACWGREIRRIEPDIPLILDFHDVYSLIEYRNFRNARGFRWKIFTFFEWRKMIRYERRVSKLFDKCLTVSEEDKNLLLSISPDADVSVIPNGVDTDFFGNPNPDEWEPKTIFFVGSDWPPNVDAMIFFYEDIFPLIKREVPDVKLYIIGGLGKNERIKSMEGENIIVTGYVDDVRPWMSRCGVSVVPMRLGGGTKVKILEALSMEKAIVSTSVGCEGIEVKNNENILIADSPEDFAKAVVTLLRDDTLCRNLGRNGRKLVEEVYDWKVIGKQLEEAYYEVLEKIGC